MGKLYRFHSFWRLVADRVYGERDCKGDLYTGVRKRSAWYVLPSQKETNIASDVSIIFSPSHLTLLKKPHFVIQVKSNFVNQNVRLKLTRVNLVPRVLSFPSSRARERANSSVSTRQGDAVGALREKKLGWECATYLPMLMALICEFPTLFMTWPKIYSLQLVPKKSLSERLLLTVLPMMMKKAARTIGSDRKVRSQQAALDYK